MTSQSKDLGRNAKLAILGQQFTQLITAGHYAQALSLAQQGLKLAPRQPSVVGDLGLCHMRLGNYEQAKRYYEQACKLAPGQSNLWDGLTEACGHLGLVQEVRQYGLRALVLKDAQTQGRAGLHLPTRLPPLSSDRSRNVIAFSLFGDLPRYCETAKLNVVAAQTCMPQWTCRFYVDESVPLVVRESLGQLGAQIVHVSADDRKELSGLMWRFLVMEDAGVDRFLLRDADSLISEREAAAVRAWLDSDSAFHLMRDYFTHTELLLAGLWGGCGGVFTNLRQQMVSFIHSGNYLGGRVVDQHFLREHVWPTVRQSVLSHDAVFGFMNGQPFPPHSPHGLDAMFHVGCNMSGSMIGSDGIPPEKTEVSWSLYDETGAVVCQYLAQVVAGSWRAELPRPYTEKIKSGRWRVQLV